MSPASYRAAPPRVSDSRVREDPRRLKIRRRWCRSRRLGRRGGGGRGRRRGRRGRGGGGRRRWRRRRARLVRGREGPLHQGAGLGLRGGVPLQVARLQGLLRLGGLGGGLLEQAPHVLGYRRRVARASGSARGTAGG